MSSERDLADMQCRPCAAGEAPLDEGAARELLEQLPGWEVACVDGVLRLRRVYRVADFIAAMAAARSIAEMAEAQGHHPDLGIAWGRLCLEWWTHSIGGLHLNDFIMAARSEQLLNP